MATIAIQIEKMYKDVEIPEYKHEGDAGMDVKAYWEDNETRTLLAGERMLVPTGIKVAIPQGYEIQVRPRSGLAIKDGITVVNSPGTIDSGYRGEIGVILLNTSNEVFLIEHGDRIAQIVLNEVGVIAWMKVDQLEDTSRSEGGFGSTGKS